MLVNDIDDATMGFLVERESDSDEIVKEYEPAVMWNLKVKSYISAPPESCTYRAYRCEVKIAGGSSFMVNFKAMDFQNSFKKCHETIMNKTFGRLILNRPIENNLWTEFVPKLLFDVKDQIKHQRPAKNIGLQFEYLLERSFEHRGVLQLDDVEVVYPDVVYNGYGQVLDEPVHCVIDEAYPHKVLVASKFTASGLRGLLKLCLPPFTATSPMRRRQQQIAIIGAIAQHHYRLIVYNCGFCPGLMLASAEPEAMKSTAAMVALKAIGDPSAFLELNSTTEYIDLYRDCTSLPLVLDDMEREKKQANLLVGSLNAANKYTIGRGKMQKLSGMIITKNIDPHRQKMPTKITEGRLNWLNMRMDPTYESEEMETNMENMFEHVNQMTNTDMPRDFLASLSKHFFRVGGEKFTTFQKLQTEACLLLEQRRPHWRKRKAKSASQFLSMFYIVEKEVTESEDEVAKRLFVEAFHSREAYIESVMEEFDETDKLEKKMSSGPSIKVPGFIYDDDDDTLEENTGAPDTDFDFNNCVLEVSNIVEDMEQVEQSKYVKLFDKDGEFSVGIHNTRIKALAKRNSTTLTPFPANVRGYPAEVKSATKTFTKLTSTSSVGASNTSAGYCMLINIKLLTSEARSQILTVLGRDDLNDDIVSLEEEGDTLSEDGDLLPSQDFPNMFQSQTSDTLLHCTHCEYLSRSKVEFEQHMGVHPICSVCRKQFDNDSTLENHMIEKHPVINVICTKCSKEFSTEAELREHMKEHEIFTSFKKALDRNPKSTPKAKAKAAATPNQAKKKKTLNCYLIFVEEHRGKMKQENPTMSANLITKKLSEAWKKLSDEEQNRYRVKAAQLKENEVDMEVASEACPKCADKFPSKSDVIDHLMTFHVGGSSGSVEPTPSTSSGSMEATQSSSSGPVDSTQSTINKCGICGRMFNRQEKLNEHIEVVHNNRAVDVDAINEQGEDQGFIAIEDDEEAENENDAENEARLVWVKLANLFWPARLVAQVDGELSKIELFDEEKTIKTVEHIKIKPFEKLKKVPAKRTKYWKDAYAKALEELEN